MDNKYWDKEILLVFPFPSQISQLTDVNYFLNSKIGASYNFMNIKKLKSPVIFIV